MFCKASNHLTDAGLISIIRYLLLPSEPPERIQPTLNTLYLSANDITLNPASPAPALLSTALSHSSSQLKVLSLTNNPIRSAKHIQAFIRHLTSPRLRVLSLNTCQLGTASAFALADWLEDHDRGGAALFALQLNGNRIAPSGVQKLSSTVISGRNTSLGNLELLANEKSFDGDIEDEAASALRLPDIQRLGLEESRSQVSEALKRNILLGEATQRAALKLLKLARLLLNAQSFQHTSEDVKQALELDQNSAVTLPLHAFVSYNPALALPIFPFTKLPIELQTHILRSYLCLKPIVDPFSSAQSLVCPLSEAQFLHVLQYAADRRTLHKLDPQHEAPVGSALWLVGGLLRISPDSSLNGRISLEDNHRLDFLQKCRCVYWDLISEVERKV